MKILVIGDLHCRLVLDRIIDKIKDFDKVIFLADYVDPYPEEQNIENDPVVYLEKIIEIKQNNIDKVELLIGNHDAHYIKPDCDCSRFDNRNYKNLNDLYTKHENLFKISYQINNILFTHAGVNKNWYDKHNETLIKHGLNNDNSNLADTLNNIWKSDDYVILLELSKHRMYYYFKELNYCGGPLWCDARDMFNNQLENMIQYVGHNQSRKQLKIQLNENIDNSYFYLLDTIGTTGEFFEIDI